MIYLWVIYIPDFIHKVDKYKSFLSSIEVENAMHFYFYEHQNRYVITKAIQRILIGKYLDLDPHLIEFEFGPFGKPYVKNQKNLYFNLSHSKDIAILAFNWGAEIGVDVEQLCPSALGQGIEEMIFSEKEAVDYLATEPNRRTELFFQTWTKKESILKCTGYGLAHDLKQVSLLEKGGILTYSFIPFPGYIGSISIDSRAPTLF